MAHRCWHCDCLCHCHGDIDDLELDYDGPCNCEARHEQLDDYDDDEIGGG
jgi:hypothetical protein